MSDYADLTPDYKVEETLLVKRKRHGGRNNQGVITTRHRGGGVKRMYRNKDGVPAVVDSIQYDPNRSARIALLHYVDGEKRYILAPDGLKKGDKLMSGPDAPPSVGNALPLSAIPLGMNVHNIEMQPGKGGCKASIGKLGNSDHMNVVLGKAGRKRWMGRRPHVRGTAMNPIDHPHGGGEGRTKGGRHPVSPTGKLAKGGHTRKRHKASNKAIVRRRWSRRYGQLKLKG